MARRTERARRAGIDRHARLLHARVRNLVDVRRWKRRTASSRGCRPARGEARAAEGIHLVGEQRSIRRRAQFHLLKSRWPIPDRERFIQPRQHQFHRRAGRLREARRQRPFHAGPELRSETAAHVIADHAHLALRHLHVIGDPVAHAENALGRGPDRDLLRRERDRVAMRLERMMQLHLGLERVLNDRRRVRETFGDVAVFAHLRFPHVLAILENLRRVRLGRVHLFDHKRNRRRLHLDQAQRVLHRLLARAGDGREFLAVIAHLAFTFTGEHRRLDPGRGFRLVQIDRGDFRRRPLRPKNRPPKPAARLHVIGIFRRAGYLRRAIEPRRGFPEIFGFFRPVGHWFAALQPSRVGWASRPPVIASRDHELQKHVSARCRNRRRRPPYPREYGHTPFHLVRRYEELRAGSPSSPPRLPGRPRRRADRFRNGRDFPNTLCAHLPRLVLASALVMPSRS